jgi:hypothetical protein
MKKYNFLILFLFLFTACFPMVETSGIDVQEQTIIETIETGTDSDAVNPECLNSEMSIFGENIAAQFENVAYEQVMAWFCSGAEFEDILVALQTEKVTGQPAQELLELLVSGLTWDEIWQSIGYIDK